MNETETLIRVDATPKPQDRGAHEYPRHILSVHQPAHGVRSCQAPDGERTIHRTALALASAPWPWLPPFVAPLTFPSA